MDFRMKLVKQMQKMNKQSFKKHVTYECGYKEALLNLTQWLFTASDNLSEKDKFEEIACSVVTLNLKQETVKKLIEYMTDHLVWASTIPELLDPIRRE